jgi:zinc transporter ZupT
MNGLPIIFSAVTFVSTLSGGLVAARFRNRFGIIAAFASGVLIAVPLFDLLPESLNLAVQINMPLEQVLYAVAVGFVFLYILERYFTVHHVCEGDECRNVRHPKGGVIGAAELSAHSFMDGLAIGLAFHLNAHVGVIVSVAVISHDFSDGLNTFTVMLHAGNSLRASMSMLLLDATTPILGALSTLFFTVPERYLVLILPFFAGGFLYLGASELLPEAHLKNPPLASLLSTLGGFALIFVVTRFLNI